MRRHKAVSLTVIAVAGLAASFATRAMSAEPQAALGRQVEAAAQMAKGAPEAAIALYSEALNDPGLENERRAMVLNDRGVAHAQLGHTKLAIDDFNRAVQLYPEHAPTYNNRGNLLFTLGMPAEAVKDFDRAIVLSPTYAAAFNNRATAYLKLGQAPQSVADYTRAIEMMASDATPLVGRGRAYLAQNLPHAAIRDFSRAVNANPRFATAFRSRAEAKLIVARTEDAIEDLSRAIQFDASSAELHVLRGQAYLGSRNAVAAVTDFQRAIELQPNLLVARQLLGLAHGEAGAIDEALADLNAALQLDPRNGVTYAYRAWVYKRAQQVEIGEKDLQTALRIAPQQPEVLWVKGTFAADLGRAQEAIEDLRRALALKPDLKAAEVVLERLGADRNDEAETDVPELAIHEWRVALRGGRHFAIYDDNKRLRVPLEMMGSGQPRLMEWVVLKGEFKGIGTLRFNGGMVAGANGPEVFEQVAIIDLSAASVVAIEPHRLGNVVAKWNWQDGKVIVSSVDGVEDQFILRKPKLPAERVAARSETRRARRDDEWDPRRSRSNYKPKSIFDMLFGN